MTTPTIILGLLTLPLLLLTFASKVVGRELLDVRWRGCIGMTLVFCFTGVGHFIKTEPMAEMLPGWVPWQVKLIYVSGVIELAVAFAVLVPRLRWIVGWSIILLLVLFLPVNVYAAVNHVGMGGHQWGPVYLLIRVPLQAILIGWTWWFAVRPAAALPISFSCTATIELAPKEISEQILDVSNWSKFDGYGLLPGIQEAEFEVRTEEVVGSRIRVQNSDGSSHVEEIVVWKPDRRLRLHMREFTPPLSRLATAFDESWELQPDGSGTKVVRCFEMHSKSALARPILWLISLTLKKAIARNLQQLSKQR